MSCCYARLERRGSLTLSTVCAGSDVRVISVVVIAALRQTHNVLLRIHLSQQFSPGHP
jgi:hypothetical protein